MNLRCLAIDDEPRALEIVVNYIKEVPFLSCVGSFRNPLKGFEFLKNNEVDLLFLDINMPNLSGIDFIKTLTKRPLIIFTTAYSEYAVESYGLDVLDYLLKPIEFHRFFVAINKAVDSQIHSKPIPVDASINKNVFVRDGHQLVKVNLNKILYIEASGNYQAIHMAQKKILSLVKMDELLQSFNSSNFVRVHRSYAVNIDHIDFIENHRIRIGGKIIPIGETYRSLLYSRL